MNKLLAAAFVALFLAGCQTDPDVAPVEDKSTATDPSAHGGRLHQRHGGRAASAARRPPARVPAAGAQGAAALKDPNNILSKRVILFEYDSFVVADQYKPMIEAHAKYLTANRNAKVDAARSRRRARLA